MFIRFLLHRIIGISTIIFISTIAPLLSSDNEIEREVDLNPRAICYYWNTFHILPPKEINFFQYERTIMEYIFNTLTYLEKLTKEPDHEITIANLLELLENMPTQLNCPALCTAIIFSDKLPRDMCYLELSFNDRTAYLDTFESLAKVIDPDALIWRALTIDLALNKEREHYNSFEELYNHLFTNNDVYKFYALKSTLETSIICEENTSLLLSFLTKIKDIGFNDLRFISDLICAFAEFAYETRLVSSESGIEALLYNVKSNRDLVNYSGNRERRIKILKKYIKENLISE